MVVPPVIRIRKLEDTEDHHPATTESTQPYLAGSASLHAEPDHVAVPISSPTAAREMPKTYAPQSRYPHTMLSCSLARKQTGFEPR